MATTNYERVGKAMDLLRQGLLPFIEREFQARLAQVAGIAASQVSAEDLAAIHSAGEGYVLNSEGRRLHRASCARRG